jgi:hypothetical protein
MSTAVKLLNARYPWRGCDSSSGWAYIRRALDAFGQELEDLIPVLERDLHPYTAEGAALDAWAGLLGLTRAAGETDANLRTRIVAAYRARFSAPTIKAVQQAIVSAVGGAVGDYPVDEWWRPGHHTAGFLAPPPFARVTSTITIPSGFSEAQLDDIRNAVLAVSGSRYYICEKHEWPQVGLAAGGSVPTASSTAAGYNVNNINDGALGAWGVAADFWKANVAVAGEWCKITGPAGSLWRLVGLGIQQENGAADRRLKELQLDFSGGETWTIDDWPDEGAGPPVGTLQRRTIPVIWTSSVQLTLNDWHNAAANNSAIGELELYVADYYELKRFIP